MTTDTNAALREWARGMFTTEAATELLIRSFQGRFAAAGNPWVMTGDDHGLWLDFDAIPSLVGALSSGEHAVLLIAASIGGNTEVNLSNGVCSLDRDHLALASILRADSDRGLFLPRWVVVSVFRGWGGLLARLSCRVGAGSTCRGWGFG